MRHPLVIVVLLGTVGCDGTYLKPSDFPALPSEVRADAWWRGCRIPQPGWVETPHNVISGSFRKAGQTDWALLCSDGYETDLLVYWGGSAREVAEIPFGPDEQRMGNASDGSGGYEWMIGTMSPESIEHNRRLADGATFPPILHDGIDEGCEKGSVVHYFHEHSWHRLPGGD